MLTTRDALAVIGAIALLRLAWTTLRARFAPLCRPPLGLIPDPRPLPPGKSRAIARAARRNRADLRHLLPTRDAGVRLVERRNHADPYVFRTDPPSLGEPPSFGGGG